jgi:tetratricopeptide (TPR) repeat protein
MKTETNLRSLLTKTGIVFIIAGISIFVYWDVQNHQFLNFDDFGYIVSNYRINNGFNLENIAWAFSFTKLSYWHPVTWLSHMLDAQLFGATPGAMHMMNLAIHILNAALLYLILSKMTGSPFKSALAALLFAVHPLNVESVAWVSERKTVLSALFFMAALYAYVRYTDKRNKWLYAVIILLYALGLMSKPIILIFPLLLLVLDYWPLQRFKKSDFQHFGPVPSWKNPMKKVISLCKSGSAPLFLEKAPFILMSLISLSISMLSLLQHKFTVAYHTVPIDFRIYNFFVSIVQYLYKIIWPVQLAIYYPFPGAIPRWHFLLSAAFVALMTVAVVIMRKNRPWLAAGWFWFLIALFPASGLIQAGLWPAMANRFMYLPLIGIFIMIIWEVDERLRGRYSRSLKVILCIAMLVFFASMTRFQNIFFSNSYALFTRCHEVTGRADEAKPYLARAIKLSPEFAVPYFNYGICLEMKGDDLNAISYFTKAIELDPNYSTGPYISLALIEHRRGNSDESVKFMEKALNIDKDDLGVHRYYGTMLSEQGKYEEAITHYLFVLKRDPTNVQVRINLALAYEKIGYSDQAMAEYQTLDAMTPKNKGHIYYRIAAVYSQKNKFKETVDYLEAAMKDGFNVWEHLKTDTGFKNFRETPDYTNFLENSAKHIK